MNADIPMWFTREQAESLGTTDPVVRAMIDVYIERQAHAERRVFQASVEADIDSLPIIHVIDTTATSELLS